MRRFFGCLVLLLCSMGSFATSYSTGEVAGFFGWTGATNVGSWTPRIPGLPYYPGLFGWNPRYLYQTEFSNAILSVTCNPLCAVGNTFSLDLTMSNFPVVGTQHRPYSYPNLNIFVGTLNLVTKPIALTSSSGIIIARFSLTGDLLGCTDATCGTTLFSLSVNTHSYAKIGYSLSGGQLSITSISYILPEPSSLALLGTGLVFILGKLRTTKWRA
jgi:hypothetical protein